MRLTPDQRDPITRPKNLSRQIALESTFYTVPPIFQILFGVVTLPKTSPLDVVVGSLLFTYYGFCSPSTCWARKRSGALGQTKVVFPFERKNYSAASTLPTLFKRPFMCLDIYICLKIAENAVQEERNQII